MTQAALPPQVTAPPPLATMQAATTPRVLAVARACNSCSCACLQRLYHRIVVNHCRRAHGHSVMSSPPMLHRQFPFIHGLLSIQGCLSDLRPSRDVHPRTFICWTSVHPGTFIHELLSISYVHPLSFVQCSLDFCPIVVLRLTFCCLVFYCLAFSFDIRLIFVQLLSDLHSTFV
jgi:hypothetical protein